MDHIELSPGPESEKTLASKTISIPKEGLLGVARGRRGGGSEALL